jgi:hypothetical protein
MKIENEVILEFSISRSGGGEVKIARFLYCFSVCVAKNIEAWLKIFISYLV